MANLPTDDTADLASLMAREQSPSTLESQLDKRQNSPIQNSSMSGIIDSYIVNLQQAGFYPNANATVSKRDTLSLDTLLEKRSVPSIPLVMDLLAQHGFVPADGTNPTKSKRDVSDVGSALEKRTLPDISLVISRLAAHGFVPTGTGNSSNSTISKRDTTSDINVVIDQLQTYGFNTKDYMQGNFSSSLSSANTSTASSSISVESYDR